MLLIISDASVLLDIEDGNLSDFIFKLPYHFTVPDTLYAEELAERHGHLKQLGLREHVMNGKLIAEAYHLKQVFRKLSVNDLLALTLAKNEGGLLLISDQYLRKTALTFNIEVHGTIWLVEQLLAQELISIQIAQEGFKRMKEAGSRLPWMMINKMLHQYSVAIIE